MSDQNAHKATFAAGQFWNLEELFRNRHGVLATQVGYMGGSVEHPTYEEVDGGKTGHAYVVEVTYDPTQISYDDLLDMFWIHHNPTTPNQQGHHSGSQYRSIIFYHTLAQKDAATLSKENLHHSHKWHHPIVTEILPVTTFYRAEEHHQQYLHKHGPLSNPV